MSANFRELIQKAIAIEAKMAEFYGKMAEEATNPEAREVFKILAGEEEEHRALLENYAKKGEFPQLPRIGESDLEPTFKVVSFNYPGYGSHRCPGVRHQVGRVSTSVL